MSVVAAISASSSHQSSRDVRPIHELRIDTSPAWEKVAPLIQAEVKHLLDVRRGQRQNINETA